MRISDWSSDVCSSDLQHKLRVERDHRGVSHHLAHGIGIELFPLGVVYGAQRFGDNGIQFRRLIVVITASEAGFGVRGVDDAGEDRRTVARRVAPAQDKGAELGVLERTRTRLKSSN